MTLCQLDVIRRTAQGGRHDEESFDLGIGKQAGRACPPARAPPADGDGSGRRGRRHRRGVRVVRGRIVRRRRDRGRFGRLQLHHSRDHLRDGQRILPRGRSEKVALKALAKHVNATGGIDGHPLSFAISDNQSTASTSVSLASPLLGQVPRAARRQRDQHRPAGRRPGTPERAGDLRPVPRRPPRRSAAPCTRRRTRRPTRPRRSSTSPSPRAGRRSPPSPRPTPRARTGGTTSSKAVAGQRRRGARSSTIRPSTPPRSA